VLIIKDDVSAAQIPIGEAIYILKS